MISVWLQSFSSRRGRRADHAGKNRTSIRRSYQKLWPLEVSASKLLIFGQKLLLNRGFNPNQGQTGSLDPYLRKYQAEFHIYSSATGL